MYIKYVLFFYFFYSLISCYSENYENLYKWLINNGAYINKKLFPKEESIYNRCILTKEKIFQKEEILFIPDKVTISTLNNIVFKKCKKDFTEYLSFATKEEASSFDFDCLVYFITIDKANNQSTFRNYYNYLPKISKSDYILFFNEEEKNNLNKIELDAQISRQNFFFNKALRPINNKIMEMENGLEEFQKNFIYVSSRNFGRRGSFYDEVNTLVPFLDLINHNNNYNSWFFYDEKRDGFILYALKDIEKNEEITISYGKFNNIYLYTMYGFTIKDNIYKSNIYLELNKEKFILFKSVNEKEIMKVVNFFKPQNLNEKKNLIIQIKNSLKLKQSIYNKYIQIYQNNINIVNICKDLKWVVNQYILFCQKLMKK